MLPLQAIDSKHIEDEQSIRSIRNKFQPLIYIIYKISHFI